MPSTSTRTAAPTALVDWLKTNTREESILDHSETVGLTWWNKGQLDMPGLPVAAGGYTVGKHELSRGEIFALAADAQNSREGALRLMWHALAWGTGTRQRGNRRRISSITSDIDRYADLLGKAARLSRTDPKAAFELLRPGRTNAITGLGPGFFTKYLYFAGGGDPAHPSLIVDSVVRATLYRETSSTDFKPWSQYPASQYMAALEVMHAWARETAELVGRPVAGDEIEKWAFRP